MQEQLNQAMLFTTRHQIVDQMHHPNRPNRDPFEPVDNRFCLCRGKQWFWVSVHCELLGQAMVDSELPQGLPVPFHGCSGQALHEDPGLFR